MQCLLRLNACRARSTARLAPPLPVTVDHASGEAATAFTQLVASLRAPLAGTARRKCASNAKLVAHRARLRMSAGAVPRDTTMSTTNASALVQSSSTLIAQTLPTSTAELALPAASPAAGLPAARSVQLAHTPWHRAARPSVWRATAVAQAFIPKAPARAASPAMPTATPALVGPLVWLVTMATS